MMLICATSTSTKASSSSGSGFLVYVYLMEPFSRGEITHAAQLIQLPVDKVGERRSATSKSSCHFAW
jgi:hypothetical protein